MRDKFWQKPNNLFTVWWSKFGENVNIESNRESNDGRRGEVS
jgi:hypothetical protein